MRFGVEETRGRRRHLLAGALGAVATAAALAGGAAVADVIRFTPNFGIDQYFTDNVRVSAGDRDADGITVLNVGLEAQVQTSRIDLATEFNIAYQEFWTSDFDNLDGAGAIGGRLKIIEDVLSIDGIAEKTQVYLSPDDGSVSGLATSVGAVELQSWAVGPSLSLDLLGLLDFEARAQYGQIQFDKPIVGIVPGFLTDLTGKTASGLLTTGDRSSLYRADLGAEYVETDLGFRMRNIIGGLRLHLTPGFTALGHLGYERIEDPLFSPVRGTVWGIGGRYEMGKHPSFIEFEYGRRYDDETYRGIVHLQVTPVIHFLSTYTDTLNPVQFTLARSLEDLYNDKGVLSVGIPRGPIVPNPLILDTIVRDKKFDLSLKYFRDYSKYAITASHFDRFYPSLSDSEKLFSIAFTAAERLSRRLSYDAILEADDRYDTVLAVGKSRYYTGGVAFAYRYNDEMKFKAGYQLGLRVTPNSADAFENVVNVSLVIPAGEDPVYAED